MTILTDCYKVTGGNYICMTCVDGGILPPGGCSNWYLSDVDKTGTVTI